jgi:hypothetical protein
MAPCAAALRVAGIAGHDRVVEFTIGGQRWDGAQLVALFANNDLGQGPSAAVLHQTDKARWDTVGDRTTQGPLPSTASATSITATSANRRVCKRVDSLGIQSHLRECGGEVVGVEPKPVCDGTSGQCPLAQPVPQEREQQKPGGALAARMPWVWNHRERLSQSAAILWLVHRVL